MATSQAQMVANLKAQYSKQNLAADGKSQLIKSNIAVPKSTGSWNVNNADAQKSASQINISSPNSPASDSGNRINFISPNGAPSSSGSGNIKFNMQAPTNPASWNVNDPTAQKNAQGINLPSTKSTGTPLTNPQINQTSDTTTPQKEVTANQNQVSQATTQAAAQQARVEKMAQTVESYQDKSAASWQNPTLSDLKTLAMTPIDQQLVNERIASYEAQTGKYVAKDSVAFQNAMKKVANDPDQWESVMKRFAHNEPLRAIGATESSTGSQIDATTGRYLINTDDTSTFSTRAYQILDANKSKSTEELLNIIYASDEETSAATLTRNQLLAELSVIQDDGLNEYLDRMETGALMSYKSSLASIDLGSDEIEKAIKGESFDAQTSEGLYAQMYQKNLELSQAYLDSSKKYEQQIYDLNVKQLQQSRAEAEGRARAYLASTTGDIDTSAGVILINKSVSEVDQQILLSGIEHEKAQRDLNLKGIELINNHTLNIAELVKGNEAKLGTALDNYQTKIDSIDKERLTSESEKRKSTLAAFKDYTKEIKSIKDKQAEEIKNKIKEDRDAAKDELDTIVKMSGLTGTIWGRDDQGKLYDTGVATYSASVSTRGYNYDVANNLLDKYGSSASGTVEKILGLEEGTLSQPTINEKKAYVDLLNSYSKVYDAVGDENTKSTISGWATKSGGAVKTAGIGDPSVLPYVKSALAAIGVKTTQGYKTTGGTDGTGGHGGLDYVTPDGYTKNLVPGIVEKVIPWNGNSPWGNQVIVRGDDGVTYQYSHLGNRNIAGDNPFNVSVGQRVEAMETLGREGNTGRVIASKGGTGVHTDLRIIKAEAPKVQSWETKTVNGSAMAGAGPTAGAAKFLYDVVNTRSATPYGYNTTTTTYDDLKTEYINNFGTYPTESDSKLLKELGPEGMDIIKKRESQKENSFYSNNQFESDTITLN